MLEHRVQRKKRTTPLLTFQPLAACREPGKLATVGDLPVARFWWRTFSRRGYAGSTFPAVE
jgi:hypothetical protein